MSDDDNYGVEDKNESIGDSQNMDESSLNSLDEEKDSDKESIEEDDALDEEELEDEEKINIITDPPGY